MCSDSDKENSQQFANNNLPAVIVAPDNCHTMDNLADYGPTLSEHEQHIRTISKKSGSQSTNRQYANMMHEYYEFAEAIFGSREITLEAVFKFLQFQAHRPLRVKEEDPPQGAMTFKSEFGGAAPEDDSSPRKRKRGTHFKKTNRSNATKYVFKVEDYTSVMDHIMKDISGTEVTEWRQTNRLGSIEKYYSAIVDSAPHEICMQIKGSREIKKLVENVNRRKKMNMVDSDSNAVCRVTEKFQYPELYKLGEEQLWNEFGTGTNWKRLASTMRTRYIFLSTTQTCTRHEATISCMLSAFEIVNFLFRLDLEPYQLVVRNIYVGKTTRRTQPQSFRPSPSGTKTQEDVSKVHWRCIFFAGFLSLMKSLIFLITLPGAKCAPLFALIFPRKSLTRRGLSKQRQPPTTRRSMKCFTSSEKINLMCCTLGDPACQFF